VVLVVVEVVVLVVAAVMLVVELVVVVVVVTGHSASPGSPVQVQSPSLHWWITFLEHWLAAMPEKAPHAELISSEQFFLPHAGGAAVATEETKTPAPSATAANVTTRLLPIFLIVIVEPPIAVPYGHLRARHRFGALPAARARRLPHGCQGGS
jgi:hypothetical protein